MTGAIASAIGRAALSPGISVLSLIRADGRRAAAIMGAPGVGRAIAAG